MTKITIGIAEDQALFRRGMVAMLNSIPEFEVILDAENGIDLLEQLDEKKIAPEIFILDLSMPEMDVIETTEVLKDRNDDAKIIIVSAHDDMDIIGHLYMKGANAFLDKNAEPEEVEYAIKSVIKRGFYINSAAKQAIKEASQHGRSTIRLESSSTSLSAREREIVKLICLEYTNSQIAERLMLQKRTIDNYRMNIMTKTKCRNIVGLVFFALQNGIVDIASLKIRH